MIRSQITVSYREIAALAAANHLIRQEVFKQSEHIACYIHYKDEFDSSSIIEAVWQAKKQCYLPILTDENSLRFVRYHPGDALHANRYSILEPVKLTEMLAPQDLDLVVMPLVAFDLYGGRLGAGGGYYDRTFSFLHKGTYKRPLIIGLAFAEQQAEVLPHDKWDIGLNGIVTEKEFMMVSKQK